MKIGKTRKEFEAALKENPSVLYDLKLKTSTDALKQHINTLYSEHCYDSYVQARREGIIPGRDTPDNPDFIKTVQDYAYILHYDDEQAKDVMNECRNTRSSKGVGTFGLSFERFRSEVLPGYEPETGYVQGPDDGTLNYAKSCYNEWAAGTLVKEICGYPFYDGSSFENEPVEFMEAAQNGIRNIGPEGIKVFDSFANKYDDIMDYVNEGLDCAKKRQAEYDKTESGRTKVPSGSIGESYLGYVDRLEHNPEMLLKDAGGEHGYYKGLIYNAYNEDCLKTYFESAPDGIIPARELKEAPVDFINKIGRLVNNGNGGISSEELNKFIPDGGGAVTEEKKLRIREECRGAMVLNGHGVCGYSYDVYKDDTAPKKKFQNDVSVAYLNEPGLTPEMRDRREYEVTSLCSYFGAVSGSNLYKPGINTHEPVEYLEAVRNALDNVTLDEYRSLYSNYSHDEKTYPGNLTETDIAHDKRECKEGLDKMKWYETCLEQGRPQGVPGKKAVQKSNNGIRFTGEVAEAMAGYLNRAETGTPEMGLGS